MGRVTFEGFLLHTYGDLLLSFSVSNTLEWHMFYPMVSKGVCVPHTEGELHDAPCAAVVLLPRVYVATAYVYTTSIIRLLAKILQL